MEILQALALIDLFNITIYHIKCLALWIYLNIVLIRLINDQAEGCEIVL